MNTPGTVKPGMASVPERPTYVIPHLLAWRLYLGLSRASLVRLSGISPVMLWYVEHGTWGLRGRHVNRIARALDVSASVLILYAPTDKRAKADATRAAMRFALRRLEPIANGAA